MRAVPSGTSLILQLPVHEFPSSFHVNKSLLRENTSRQPQSYDPRQPTTISSFHLLVFSSCLFVFSSIINFPIQRFPTIQISSLRRLEPCITRLPASPFTSLTITHLSSQPNLVCCTPYSTNIPDELSPNSAVSSFRSSLSRSHSRLWLTLISLLDGLYILAHHAINALNVRHLQFPSRVFACLRRVSFTSRGRSN